MGIAIPLTLADASPFVVLFLSLSESNFQFGPTTLPVERQGHQGVTLALNTPDQFADLVAMQEELAGTGRIGRDVG